VRAWQARRGRLAAGRTQDLRTRVLFLLGRVRRLGIERAAIEEELEALRRALDDLA
jgi:hypothetical protein